MTTPSPAFLDWPLFASTFALIFVAELPDKTAFATLLLAARGKPWPIFFGAAAAFAVQTAVAVSLGRVLGLLPERTVHLASGLLFFFFAALEWRKSVGDEEDAAEREIAGRSMGNSWRAALSAFVVIFLAEWGDLTQLATVSLVARTPQPATIFVAAILALWSVTALAILLGQYAKRYLHQRRLQRIAAVVFFLVGTHFLLKDFGVW
jgi:putative Ca2+/H+ antiporter (TMEM165/GDT1 family)